MLTGVIFVTDKAKTGQVGTITAAAAEGLVWYSITIPLSVPFILESGPESVFQGGNNMVSGETLGVMVLS